MQWIFRREILLKKKGCNCIGEGRVKDDSKNSTSDLSVVLCGTIQGRRFLDEGQLGDGANERKRELPCGIKALSFLGGFLVEMSNKHLDILLPGTQMKSMCQKYKFKSH